jgi:uncharacterized membrane protein YkvA (DUF1232 family)
MAAGKPPVRASAVRLQTEVQRSHRPMHSTTAEKPLAIPSSGDSSASPPLEVEVLDGVPLDQGLLLRLLRRVGRTLARPALECLELLLDGATPYPVRLTMLGALTYLLLPLDLIPDFIPAAGFSDDLVALTALLGLCSRHLTPAIRERAQRRLDAWFPPSR